MPNTNLYSTKTDAELLEFEKRDELQTGIDSIDENFGFPTGYYIVIGNPGTGKSWFATWLSRVFYRHNEKRSVIFSLEMPEVFLRQRILQQWSDLTKHEIDSGKSTSKALELIKKDAIVVDDFFSENTKLQTPQAFKKKIDEYYKLGYRCFHMDHFHELEGTTVNERNQKAVEKWGLMFQQICKEYDDIWLFIYAQPNSGSATKKVLRRTDMMGGKALTYKCDYFLSLNRDLSLEDGMIKIDDNDRTIVFWVDKSRYTEKSHIGFRLEFSETGNFYGKV